MPEVKIRSSCDSCLKTKVKCSQSRPECARCSYHGRECVYSQYRKIGRPSTKGLSLTRPTQQQQQQQQQQQPQPQQQPWGDIAGSTGRRLTPASPQQGSQPPTDGLAVHPSCLLSGSSSEPFTLLQEGDALMLGADEHIASSSSSSSSSLNAPLDGTMESMIDWTNLEQFLDVMAPYETGLPQPPPDQPPLDDMILGGTLTPASLGPHHTAPGPIERLFVVPSDFSLFAPPNPMMEWLPCSRDTVQPPPQGPRLGSPASVPTASDPPSDCGNGRCTFYCYADLTQQLARVSEWQRPSARVALDGLLTLDDQVRRTRDKILRCRVCLAGTVGAQTLMLLTMVVANVLGLFENRCGGTPAVVSRRDGGSGTSSPGSRLPSTAGSVRPPTLPLMVGDLQLDEAVARAFSQRLVRLYLDRQRAVVRQLQQLLERAEGHDASIKLTADLLRDVLGRLERFIGVITLHARLELRLWH